MSMKKLAKRIYISWMAIAALGLLCTACGPRSIGRSFSLSTAAQIKVGHDQKRDVLKKMGAPLRKTIDGSGGEIFTYLWADGRGSGQKCIIAFNKNGTVSLVQVVP